MTVSEALKIFDLKPDATQEDIRNAYHDLVMFWHPDRHQNNSRNKVKAEEKIKLINNAKDVLSDYHPDVYYAEIENNEKSKNKKTTDTYKESCSKSTSQNDVNNKYDFSDYQSNSILHSR